LQNRRLWVRFLPLVQFTERKQKVKKLVNYIKESFEEFQDMIPELVTPGAAEALAVKVYRLIKTEGKSATEALKACLDGYRNPISPEVLRSQIRMAIEEATDVEFVPEAMRKIAG
ncbi:MAG: hypothetical protein AAGA58_14380, partial [Verrucomicrobiota bacterium]